jgi:hypothetical protein
MLKIRKIKLPLSMRFVLPSDRMEKQNAGLIFVYCHVAEFYRELTFPIR